MTTHLVALVHGRALVGSGLELIEPATLVIRDTKIAWVGPDSDAAVPSEAEQLDAAGLTLLPGFIDAHVHVGLASPKDIVTRGVTTVRDLGWPPDQIWPVVEASHTMGFVGPRVVAVGQMLTAPGGYPTTAEWAPPGTGLEVAGSEHAAGAVEHQARAGACAIKVALNPPSGPVLDALTLRGVVEAAHSAGLTVTAHIYGSAELAKAMDAGVDELAHMVMSEERLADELLGRMVAERVVIVPTLAIRRGRDLALAIDNLRRYLERGGTVVYGTDLGNYGPRPGIDPTEVDAMSAAGMSLRDVIASATVTSARHLKLRNTGVLQAGYTADVIAVDGDAASEPSALTRCEIVFRAGRRLR